jgi:hypothetical protein
MPELCTRASIASARNLPFCYSCGRPVTKRDNHPDHVPPRAIFAEADRDFPLKVAAHRACNNPQSSRDEVIGQLIAVIHGKYPDREHARLKPIVLETPEDGTPVLIFRDTGLPDQVWRWVRAFHAALYREFLPPDTRLALHLPVPSGTGTEDRLTVHGIYPQQYLFAEIVKKNRVARSLDRIECYNGQCVYECVWVQMDRGRWACVFGLKIYNWIVLGDKRLPSRGCVGLYEPKSGRPASGTKWTGLEFPVLNLAPLDPFGS